MSTEFVKLISGKPEYCFWHLKMHTKEAPLFKIIITWKKSMDVNYEGKIIINRNFICKMDSLKGNIKTSGIIIFAT